MPAISSVKVIINAHSGVTDKEEVRRGLSEVCEAGGVTADITIAKGGEIARLARQTARRPALRVSAPPREAAHGCPGAGRPDSRHDLRKIDLLFFCA